MVLDGAVRWGFIFSFFLKKYKSITFSWVLRKKQLRTQKYHTKSTFYAILMNPPRARASKNLQIWTFSSFCEGDMMVSCLVLKNKFKTLTFHEGTGQRSAFLCNVFFVFDYLCPTILLYTMEGWVKLWCSDALILPEKTSCTVKLWGINNHAPMLSFPLKRLQNHASMPKVSPIKLHMKRQKKNEQATQYRWSVIAPKASVTAARLACSE